MFAYEHSWLTVRYTYRRRCCFLLEYTAGHTHTHTLQ